MTPGLGEVSRLDAATQSSGVRGGAVRRAAQRLETGGPAQQIGVGVRRPREREADRHPDVGHRAHRHRDRRDAEVADREVAVGDPDSVPPRCGRGLLVHVGVGGAHVGHRGEDHRIEAEAPHPVFEVHASGALETLQPGADECGARPAQRVGHPARASSRDVLRDVEVEGAVPVGQCALGMREDLRALDLGERRKPGLAVRRQEVVPRPHRHVPDLDVEEVRRHDAALEDRRSSRRGRPHSCSPRGSRRPRPRRPPPRGLLAPAPTGRGLPGGARCAAPSRLRCRAGAGIRILPEVHRRDAEPLAARDSPRRRRPEPDTTRAAPRTRAESAPTAASSTGRRGVSGSSATRTSSTSSRSAIVRVCGTTTSIVGTSGQLPRTEMTPREGV